MKKKIGIIGGGPAGCMCAINLDKEFDITIFDTNPLKTILPTGGGRCNLAFAEYDFKELAKYYPRGEKFLYSVFSQFSTADTIEFFDKIGIGTYMQDDLRFFPKTNSSKDVREGMLKKLKHCTIKHEKVNSIKEFEFKYEVKTEQHSYSFDYVVVAIGGHGNFEMIKNLGHNIIEPKPSLVGLITQDNYSELKGVSLKNVRATFDKKTLDGDIIFTHKGISGPLVYKISSIKARDNMPYTVRFDFINKEIDLQKIFDTNPHKDLTNILSEFMPKSLVKYFLKTEKINGEQKGSQINRETREKVLNTFCQKEIVFIATQKDGETVTCGGVDLKEIEPKTLKSKVCKNLYFCGEVLDIDGFCNGFNLQNCWSSGYVVANSINTF